MTFERQLYRSEDDRKIIMLRAVMDAISDDMLLPALVIEMKSACHCPGRENGSAKRAIRLRRPDGLGEAEERKICDMGSEHLPGPDNGNSQPEHDRHTQQPQQKPGFEGRDLEKAAKAAVSNASETLESAVVSA